MTAGDFPDLPADRDRRARMVREQLDECDDPRVVAAMAELPRHHFVPPALTADAYDDGALAIAAGQAISQPRVVAAMLAALRLGPGMAVLDVGCGSGYAAALIARLVAPGGRVLAIERQAALIPPAAAVLAHHAPRVELRHGDGLAGAPEAAPFAAIHIACACSELPTELAAQLAPGGRLVLPLGAHDGAQRLTLATRSPTGELTTTDLGDVRFVPALPGTVADGPRR